MSTTTQILFNSPALHSLKRDQLVKLCKIHSIKASGKNVELIQKLRQHALQLPKDSPLSIAARSELEGPIPIQPEMRNEEEEEEVPDDASYRTQIPRQSEQWEMVMDSIEEVEEESSQGTLTSQRTFNNGGTGEFGTGSSKSTTVSSSIKALANSLGLKRGNSKSTIESTSSKASAFPLTPYQDVNDELALKSTPYSSLPPPTSMPQTDHFTLESNRMSIDGNTDAPLPGHALRPGVPAPANARLSLGFGLGAPSTPMRQAQPTTTIRLVSNPLLSQADPSYEAGVNGTPQLKPFKTTFDLTFGSPAPGSAGFGFGNMSSWPPRSDGDVHMKGIYPTLTFDDLPPSVPGSPAVSRAKSPEPFVFGSPLPKNNVSDQQFRVAAASVLEEMNARLREDGVDPIDIDIIAKLHPNTKTESPREIRPIPSAKRTGEITNKFQKLHEEEFQKMEGIDSLVKKRSQILQAKKPAEVEKVVLGKKRKSSAIERDSGAGPRRPSAIAGRASTTRVISNGRRARLIPGAFGMDDDDDNDDEEQEEEERGGKRVRMDPEASLSGMTPEEEQKQQAEEQRRRLELEKEVIRKKLEANRVRRRSSAAHGGPAARKSIGRPRPSVLVKPKPKPSRFGFLSSAKSLVQNVWNRGKAPESNIPKAVPVAKPEPPKQKMGPPTLVPAKKATAAPARPTPAVASGSKGPSLGSNLKAEDNPTTKGTVTSVSSRSRSPLPSFNTSSSRNSLLSNGNTQRSRTSSAVGPSSRASSIMGTGASKSRLSSNNVSSVGTKTSTARMSTVGSVGSMGAKKMMSGSSNSRTSMTGTASSSRSRLTSISSRLFAPTASSLAKTNRPSNAVSSSELKPVAEDKRNGQSALGTITNDPSVTSPTPKSPLGTPGAFSPKSGAIFSKPLVMQMQQQSAIPTPVKKRTLSGSSVADVDEDGSQSQNKAETSSTGATASGAPRVRSLNGRKPRISRSKVIARLASQRAASGSSTASSSSRKSLAPRASGVGGAGKTRSSLGAKVSRASYGGGVKARSSGAANGVVMSAKKRARQSEYARRRSRIGTAGSDAPSGAIEHAMEL